MAPGADGSVSDGVPAAAIATCSKDKKPNPTGTHEQSLVEEKQEDRKTQYKATDAGAARRERVNVAAEFRKAGKAEAMAASRRAATLTLDQVDGASVSIDICSDVEADDDAQRDAKIAAQVSQLGADMAGVANSTAAAPDAAEAAPTPAGQLFPGGVAHIESPASHPEATC